MRFTGSYTEVKPNKVNLVTNSLKTGHEAIAAQKKESGTSTKRLSSDASGSSSKRSLLVQDAPQKQTSSEQEFMEIPPHKQIYLIHQRRRVPLKLALDEKMDLHG